MAAADGRLHHVTYATDQREDILRAADIFLENGVHIETGPHKHAIQGTFFLYVWEPAGNRVEVANAGAQRRGDESEYPGDCRPTGRSPFADLSASSSQCVRLRNRTGRDTGPPHPIWLRQKHH